MKLLFLRPMSGRGRDNASITFMCKGNKNFNWIFTTGVQNDRCPEKAGPVWFYLDNDSTWKRDDLTLKIECLSNSN